MMETQTCNCQKGQIVYICGTQRCKHPSKFCQSCIKKHQDHTYIKYKQKYRFFKTNTTKDNFIKQLKMNNSLASSVINFIIQYQNKLVQMLIYIVRSCFAENIIKQNQFFIKLVMNELYQEKIQQIESPYITKEEIVKIVSQTKMIQSKIFNNSQSHRQLALKMQQKMPNIFTQLTEFVTTFLTKKLTPLNPIQKVTQRTIQKKIQENDLKYDQQKRKEKLKPFPNVIQDKKYKKLRDISSLDFTNNEAFLMNASNQIPDIFSHGTRNQSYYLITFPNLKYLQFENNRICTIKNLQTLTKLTYLNLKSNYITKIQNLDTLQSLQKLYLNQNHISKIQGLQTLYSLQELYFGFNFIDKIQGLEHLKKLQILELQYNNITKIEGLNENKNLNTLDLTKNQITLIENLAHLHKLQKLFLLQNHLLIPEGYQYLKQKNEMKNSKQIQIYSQVAFVLQSTKTKIEFIQRLKEEVQTAQKQKKFELLVPSTKSKIMILLLLFTQRNELLAQQNLFGHKIINFREKQLTLVWNSDKQAQSIKQSISQINQCKDWMQITQNKIYEQLKYYVQQFEEIFEKMLKKKQVSTEQDQDQDYESSKLNKIFMFIKKYRHKKTNQDFDKIFELFFLSGCIPSLSQIKSTETNIKTKIYQIFLKLDFIWKQCKNQKKQIHYKEKSQKLLKNIKDLNNLDLKKAKKKFQQLYQSISKKLQTKKKKYRKVKFDKNDKLGEGTYAKVYKGFITQTNQVVAIKVLNQSYSKLKANPKLKRELKILDMLKYREHDNIVNFHFWTVVDDQVRIVTEMCDQINLKKILQQREKLSEQQIYKLFFQIILAIHFLHTFPLIHRDLSPNNILIKNNCVKIVDFGCSRALKQNQQGASTLSQGTLAYSSPQGIKFIQNSKKYTPKYDIWAIGCLIYQMLTGQVFYIKFYKNEQWNFNIKSLLQNLMNKWTQDKWRFWKQVLERTLVVEEDDRIDSTELVKLFEEQDQKRKKQVTQLIQEQS